jgi:predicted O-linked N-acetylglucosamine transferase (SPINDLY family)
LKRFEEAAKDCESLLKLDPEFKYTRGFLAFFRLQCCDWRDLERQKREIATGLRAGKRVVAPFANVALSQSEGDQLSCARICVADRYPASSRPLWQSERYRHDRIRLAYLSGDFNNSAVATLMAGVFEHHDRARFETIAVSFARDDESPMRARLGRCFDRFMEVQEQSDAEVAELLRRMEVDIAVDLMGFTGECRPGILAFRPAPVQVNYLGFPGTMGADYIDAIIADRTVIPEESVGDYSEAVVYLPDTYLPNDATRRIAERTPTRSEAGLPEKGFVFCSFNNSYKFTPELFDIWMRLLSRVEGSVLWLPEVNAAAVRNLRREAASRGIDENRLVFAPFLASAEDHLARLRLADLFLDTLPYNAHTTAADALWAGLPVLTTPGSTFAGRVAASLIKAIGLPEMIAPSPEAYEAMALQLARDANALAEIKAKLQRNRGIHALFDTARFTRSLEAAYAKLYERAPLNPAARS